MTAAVHPNGHEIQAPPGKWHPGGPGRPPNAIQAAAKKAGTTKIGRRKKGGKAKAPKAEKAGSKTTAKKPKAKKPKAKRASVQARMTETPAEMPTSLEEIHGQHKARVAAVAAEDRQLVLAALTDLERGVGGLWFNVERFVRVALDKGSVVVGRGCSELMLHARAFLAALENTRAAATATI